MKMKMEGDDSGATGLSKSSFPFDDGNIIANARKFTFCGLLYLELLS